MADTAAWVDSALCVTLAVLGQNASSQKEDHEDHLCNSLSLSALDAIERLVIESWPKKRRTECKGSSIASGTHFAHLTGFIGLEALPSPRSRRRAKPLHQGSKINQ